MTQTPLFFESNERLVGTDWQDFAYPIIQDYATPGVILDEIQKSVELVQWYPYLEAELCAAIGAYVGVPPDWILPVPGASGGLDLIARRWFAGQQVAVPFPAFWQLVEAPRRYRARLETPAITDTDAEPLPRELASGGVAKEAVAILLCSPHNPLGTVLTHETVERLLRTCGRTLVVVDESYADLDATSLLPALQHPNLVIVRGFKTFLIPGARIGYIVAHPNRIADLRTTTVPFGLSVLAEAAALSALRHLSEIRAIWDRVRADLRYLESRLLELGGQLVPSRTLFALWRHPQAKRLGQLLFETRTAVVSAPRPTIAGMPDDAMRITSRKPEHVDRFAETLRKLLARCPTGPETLDRSGGRS